jgi:DNA-binding MarR family transcriptional regulator
VSIKGGKGHFRIKCIIYSNKNVGVSICCNAIVKLRTMVAIYNSFMLQLDGGDNMKNQGSNYLRELIRLLVRNLDILEKSDSNCCGVTLSQCHAIVEVGRAEEVSLNDLAELLTLDKSTMSRTINNLVEEGLIVRELHPEDRRYIIIKLTEEGINVFNNIEEGMDQYYKSVFTSIPECSREQVLDSLKLLIEAVNQNKC